MGTITFDVKAQLERLTGGKMEVKLESESGKFETPCDWEKSILAKYRGEDKKMEKVRDLLTEYAKRKKKEPLFKKKLAVLEQQKFVDNPVSRTWKELAEKGLRFARDDLRRNYGMDYINKKFVKI